MKNFEKFLSPAPIDEAGGDGTAGSMSEKQDRKVDAFPSDEATFRAYCALNKVRLAGIEEEDRQWCDALISIRPLKLRDETVAIAANREKLVVLEKKYAGIKTGVYKKIDMSVESLATVFGKRWLDPIDIPDILALGVEEVGVFENRVGNWKPVPLIVIKGKKYVLKKVKPEYFAEYVKIKEVEHRPDMQEVIVNGNHYGLFEFKGDKVMDFTNKQHLEQLCEIGIASAKRGTTFDPNEGNLLVEDGRLYYIDVGLDYTKISSTAKAMLANLYYVVQHIPQVMQQTAFLETILYCVQQFKKEAAPLPLEKEESPEALIDDEMRHLLRLSEELSSEVKQKIHFALMELFSKK